MLFLHTPGLRGLHMAAHRELCNAYNRKSSRPQKHDNASTVRVGHPSPLLGTATLAAATGQHMMSHKRGCACLCQLGSHTLTLTGPPHTCLLCPRLVRLITFPIGRP